MRKVQGEGGKEKEKPEWEIPRLAVDGHNAPVPVDPVNFTADQHLKVDSFIYAGRYPSAKSRTASSGSYVHESRPPKARGIRPTHGCSRSLHSKSRSSLRNKPPICKRNAGKNRPRHSSVSWIPAHGPSFTGVVGATAPHSIHEKETRISSQSQTALRMARRTHPAQLRALKLLSLYAHDDFITDDRFCCCRTYAKETSARKYWFILLFFTMLRHQRQPLPPRRGRRVESIPLRLPFVPTFEISVFAQNSRTRPPPPWNSSRRLEAQPDLHADRRRRSPPRKWYSSSKSRALEAKRTGSEMKHPMQGPVTLKWRS